jgi:cardiolipin synthase
MMEWQQQQASRTLDEQPQCMHFFRKVNNALPFEGNDIKVYTDGYSMVQSLLSTIAKAKHHIHLEFYIFENDAVGRLVRDALMDKAREGVEVRVLYDDVGCWKVDHLFYDAMREVGIEVRSFLKVRFPRFTSKVNYRNHRKLCVVDGKIGFIGGMNIALRYVKGMRHQGWRDTHLRVEGSGVYAIQRAFLIDWYFVDRTLITSRKYYPEINKDICNDCIMQVVTSSPITQWPDIMQGYVRILLQAKKYVYMETPYFLPTEPILFALRTAALAGVDVRLMIPEHGDAKLVEWASRSYVFEVAEAGVSVYYYKGEFNHSKLLVSDDSICTCGSTNVDFRSFENNFESNAFFYDEDMALRMKNVYLEDEKLCVPLKKLKNINHLPFGERLWESLIRLLSPLM